MKNFNFACMKRFRLIAFRKCGQKTQKQKNLIHHILNICILDACAYKFLQDGRFGKIFQVLARPIICKIEQEDLNDASLICGRLNIFLVFFMKYSFN